MTLESRWTWEQERPVGTVVTPGYWDIFGVPCSEQTWIESHIKGDAWTGTTVAYFELLQLAVEKRYVGKAAQAVYSISIFPMTDFTCEDASIDRSTLLWWEPAANCTAARRTFERAKTYVVEHYQDFVKPRGGR